MTAIIQLIPLCFTGILGVGFILIAYSIAQLFS